MKNYVDVIVKLNVKKNFTYHWPDSLPAAKRGMLVVVPFKNSQKVAIVLGPGRELKSAKSIIKLLSPEPVLGEREFRFAHFISSRYFVSLAEALFSLLPAGFMKEKSYPSLELQKIAFPELTPSQQAVFQNIGPGANLLLGVTGAGKTEIYIRKAYEALKAGKQVLILVPEIALTPQTYLWFQKKLKVPVFRYHSRLKKKERVGVWWGVKKGKIRLVVGSRSAILLPFQSLGLLVIDEEQDASYKQEQSPYYDARDLAYFLTKTNPSLTTIFGSATPSLITYAKALRGDIKLHRLRKRFLGELPKVIVVDIRGTKSLLSPTLRDYLRAVLERGRQAVLFLDRRGEVSGIFCVECGNAILCPRCDLPLVYHLEGDTLLCHHCGLKKKLPKVCPLCKKINFLPKRFGVERLALEVEKLFPSAKICRADRDILKRKDIEEIYRTFRKHQCEILIGTRMIAKGWDIPDVDLVGVVDADLSLFFPDYKASEETHMLLSQVIGRAGRRKKGFAIIQTRSPEHPVIQAVCHQDYEAFAKKELFLRKKENFPPFCEIVRLLVKHKNQEKAFMIAQSALKKLQVETKGLSEKELEILGPSSCFFNKIASKYRVHLVLKVKRLSPQLIEVLKALQAEKSLSVLRNPSDLL